MPTTGTAAMIAQMKPLRPKKRRKITKTLKGKK